MSTPIVTDPAAPEPQEAPVIDGAKPSDEPLGAPGISALKAEREARAAAEKRESEALQRIKEFEDRDKTESERQAEALAAAKRELAELTIAKTRAEVAATKGVPAGLLTGSTQEELEAAADALLAFKGEPVKPSAAPIVEGQVTPAVDLDAAIRAAEAARNFPLAITLKQQKAAQPKG